MRILSWLGNLCPFSWGSNRRNSTIQSPDYENFPELKTIEKAGASDEQLIACQEVFELMLERGFTDFIGKLEEAYAWLIKEKGSGVTTEYIMALVGIAGLIRMVHSDWKDIKGLAESFKIAIETGSTPKD